MASLIGLRGWWRSFSGRPIRCPTCSEEGYDSHGSPHASFEQRGRWETAPVRKCLNCGSGLLIKGHRFEAIPAEKWAAMEQYYETETARLNAEMDADDEARRSRRSAEGGRRRWRRTG